MRIELINTGAELMLGRVLNSHQQWLCRQLADRGYRVTRQVAVDDSVASITGAVRESLARADLVITTGGLGPTNDDRTREEVASLLGLPLVRHEETLRRIVALFEKRKRLMPDRVKIQSLAPEGADVLPNDFGTAPGLAIRVEPGRFQDDSGSRLVMLPGPPRELRPMFTQYVVPLLARAFPRPAPFVCRTLRTTGIGESQVEALIDVPLESLQERGLELAYCSRVGSVDIRLVAEGDDAAALVQRAEEIILAKVADHLYASDDENLAAVLVKRLTETHQTLALAESCTGGSIANCITDIPGASAVLLAGVVSYSNEAKHRLLGVRAETLSAHGAVSEPVAREMAEGARANTGADFALGITGIAGPAGGSPEKPVGTVFIGLATPTDTTVVRNYNAYDRVTFKEVTTMQALNLLRKRIQSGRK